MGETVLSSVPLRWFPEDNWETPCTVLNDPLSWAPIWELENYLVTSKVIKPSVVHTFNLLGSSLNGVHTFQCRAMWIEKLGRRIHLHLFSICLHTPIQKVGKK